MTQTPALTGSSVAGSTAPTALFNPRHVRRRRIRRGDPPRPARDDRVVRVARQGRAEGARPRPHLVRGLPGVRRARAHLRDAADAGRARRAATRTSAGTPRGSARSTRSPPSTGWPTGTRGRSRSSGSARSGRATTRRRAQRAAELLDDGAIFAFGLSEQEHGADIYSTDMVLTPDGDGRLHRERRQVLHRQRQPGRHGLGLRPPRRRRGPGRLRLLRRRQPAPDLRAGQERRQLADLRQRVPARRLPGRAPRTSCTPARTPSTRRSTPSTSASSTSASPRSASASTRFYEAITHADGRVLYGTQGHRLPARRARCSPTPTRAWSAMKLFGDRAIDYFRSAAPEDRRYLLFNPITKMKVTTEGERVIDLLWDVIAAKGFEKDTYFEMAARDIRGAAEARGHRAREHGAGPEVHGRTTCSTPAEHAPVPQRRDAGRRRVPVPPGPGARARRRSASTTGAPAYDAVRRRAERRPLHRAGRGLQRRCCRPRRRTRSSSSDLDFLLTLGELFTLVVYGQLILEQAELTGLDRDTLDQIFDVLVRDFSAYAVDLHGKPSSTEAQQAWALEHVRKPVVDAERFDRVFGAGRRRSRAPTRCARERLMPGGRIQGIVSSLIDTLLDRTVAPGYTRVGYAVRSHGWDALPRMDGKVVLVTGATAGLGRAAAEGFARLGASVRLLARDAGRGEAARAAIARGDRQRRRARRHRRHERPGVACGASPRSSSRPRSAWTCSSTTRASCRQERDALARRIRARVRDERPRPVPAHRAAAPAAARERAGADRQRLLRRHVHRAHPTSTTCRPSAWSSTAPPSTRAPSARR